MSAGSARVPLLPAHPGLAEAAAALAARWALAGDGAQAEYHLVLTDERLELRRGGPDAPGPVHVDFVGGAVGHRHRFGGGRGQPIARAVALKGRPPARLIDATAGLGRDAFLFASLGSEVVLVERSPVLAALLEDGLRRAAADAEVAPIAARMHLVHGDAAVLLGPGGLCADVVYLDPMFPPRDKSALVKKEMQALHRVVGSDPDADHLLAAALGAARRVVVKRPGKAPPLADRRPDAVVATPNHRFDLYFAKLPCEERRPLEQQISQ